MLDPYKAPKSGFFQAWTTVVLRFRWLLGFVSLLITGFSLLQVHTRLIADTSFDAFLASDSEPARVLEEFRDEFGNDRVYDILIEGEVFSLPYLTRLKKLHEQIASLDMEIGSLGERKKDVRGQGESTPSQPWEQGEGVQKEFPGTTNDAFEDFDETFSDSDGFIDSSEDDNWGESSGSSVIENVVSLINARRTTWKSGGLNSEGLFDEMPTAEQLPKIKQDTLRKDHLVGQIAQILDGVGRHSVIIVQTQFMNQKDQLRIYNELKKLIVPYQAEDFRITITGLQALTFSLNSKMLDDLYKLLGISLLVMITFLALIFRHPWGIFGPIAVVLQSAIWTLGLMAYCGVPITIVTNVLPTFLLCVGIAGSVHIQSVYRDSRKKDISNRDAIIHAVATTGIPVFFTSLTTCMGLFSFRFATLQAIQDMGTFGAFGVAISLLQSLIFLPIVLTFNKNSLFGVKTQSDRKDILDRFLNLCNLISKPRVSKDHISHLPRYVVLCIASLFLVGGCYGTSMVYAGQNPLNWLPEDDPVIQDFDRMNRHLGGAAHLLLLIETNKGKNLKDRHLLLLLEKLERKIKTYRDPKSEHEQEVIGATASLLDIVRESYRAVNNNQQSYYRIPETQRGVVDMLTLFENASPDELKRICTLDLKKTFTTMRVHWMDAWEFEPLTDHIERCIKEVIGDHATVKTTGSVNNNVAIIRELFSDLFNSFGTAFVVITLTMILLLRNLRLGLIAMVPNLLPMVMVLGFMGYTSIPLNISNLMIWSIAIGLIVDNTIHFLHQFRTHYQLNHQVDAAIAHSFKHTGRPITVTTIILVSGFLVYLAAHLRNIQLLGQLLALVLTLAMITNLIFAPALLRTLYKQNNTPE